MTDAAPDAPWPHAESPPTADPPAGGSPPAGESPPTGESPPFNLRMPTLGGRQFWGDVCHFRGWRIQQNVFTGHFRLLDPQDVRHAWGTRAQCQSELCRLRAERQLPPLAGKAAILAHGITRSSKSFAQLQARLEQDGYIVVPFDYPSTRLSIPDCAEYLRQVIESQEGIKRIDFVTHSMGGLLVRAYLAATADAPDPRLGRLVMIGPPNLGAQLATMLREQVLFKAIYGPSGQQLVDDPAGLIARLPTPGFEFAVIAGSHGDERGYNPLLEGDDDGVVSVASTRLPGAADFLAVRGVHSLLLSHPDVIAAAARFLSAGALRPDGHREPIPSDAQSTDTPQ